MGDGRGAALQVVERFERERAGKPAGVIARRPGRNRHELVGVRDIERSQGQVHETEQRCIRAQADCEREHRRSRERLVRREEAQRVPKIRHVGFADLDLAQQPTRQSTAEEPLRCLNLRRRVDGGQDPALRGSDRGGSISIAAYRRPGARDDLVSARAGRTHPPRPRRRLQPAAPSSTGAPALPVRRVVLYKTGVGYFEHLGNVRNRQDVAIRFTSAQLNDVLKSLTTIDMGEGRSPGSATTRLRRWNSGSGAAHPARAARPRWICWPRFAAHASK